MTVNLIPDCEFLQNAAKAARAHADELKRIADEAWFAFDEAAALATDAEIAVGDWDEVVRGDVSVQEFFEMKDAAASDWFAFEI